MIHSKVKLRHSYTSKEVDVRISTMLMNHHVEAASAKVC